jgi:hypothetical protein
MVFIGFKKTAFPSAMLTDTDRKGRAHRALVPRKTPQDEHDQKKSKEHPDDTPSCDNLRTATSIFVCLDAPGANWDREALSSMFTSLYFPISSYRASKSNDDPASMLQFSPHGDTPSKSARA